MLLRRSSRRALSVAVGAALVLAACGGGGDEEADATTTAAATSSSTSSSVARTTSTTVARTTTSTAPASTTTVAPGPTFPLTGLPVDDAARLNRPALVIKINNVASARPQFGINEADVVFEEKIGSAVTRLLSVFHSTDAEKVGSIRSARASDLPILTALSKPLFVWSGANQNLTPVIRRTDATDLGYSNHSGLYIRGRQLRDYTEFFVSTPSVWAESPEGQGAPAPIFAFRTATDPAPTGQPVKGVVWSKNGYVVDWTWDPDKGWLRNQSGTPHVDAAGTQVAAANVVMMYVTYKSAFDDPRSPEAVTTGKGEVWVLVNGIASAGTWEREKPTDPFVFKDADGNLLKLNPGKTWVELAEPESGELVI
jgi:hypothetical protein